MADFLSQDLSHHVGWEKMCCPLISQRIRKFKFKFSFQIQLEENLASPRDKLPKCSASSYGM